MLRVGELARQSGLTVRTLHYYDEIGLLRPSRRSGGGHRLYAVSDVARLQQIRSLQQIGLALDDIRRCLDRSGFSLQEAIAMHLAQLTDQIERLRGLRARLEGIARHIEQDHELTVAQFTETMEMMKNVESYYTPEQLEQLRARREALGDDKISAAQNEWGSLVTQVRAQMQAGADPRSQAVRTLARRWQGLVAQFTGGDPGIAASLQKMYQEQPKTADRFGIDAEIREFIAKAMASDGGGSGS